VSKQKYYITPNVLYQNPQLLQGIRSSESKADKVKHLNAKLTELRGVYRYLRDKKEFKGTAILQEMYRVFLDSLLSKTTTYYKEVKSLVELAGYIESRIVYLPENQIPLWVHNVTLEEIYSVVRYGILNCYNTAKIKGTQALLGAFLWQKVFGTSPTTLSRLLYEFSGFKQVDKKITKGKTFIEQCRKSYGIEVGFEVNNPKEYYKEVRLHWNEDILTNGTTWENVEDKNYGSAKPLKGPIVPDDLWREIYLHNIYYPVLSYQFYDETCSVILSDGEQVSIPILPGIVPILIATLVPYYVLRTWLLEAGTTRPKIMIKKLYEDADNWIQHLNQLLRYPSPESLARRAAERGFVYEYMRAQYQIMQNGLPINISSLLSAAKNEYKKTGNRHILSTAESIEKAINQTGGYYRGVHHFHSKSERIYYRMHNIQALPGSLKQGVEVAADNVLVSVDIVSNDLSVLFNLADDKEGLKLLRQKNRGGHQNGQLNYETDPYYRIAKAAYGKTRLEAKHRDQVKTVFNPWLYGQKPGNIGKENTIPLDEVNRILEAIESVFPDAYTWLMNLSEAVKASWKIPASMNPIENVDIAMPRWFHRRVAPTLVIQRMGANIMKSVVRWLQLHDNFPGEILLTVHDSLLIRCRQEDKMLMIPGVRYAFDNAMRESTNRAIQVLNLRVGFGQTWAEAEVNPETFVCEQLPPIDTSE